nr:auxin-responsive protein SAUR71-like [Pinus koraiensis]
MQSKRKISGLLSLILGIWRRPRLAVPRTRLFRTSCSMMPLINPRRCRSWRHNDMAPEGYFAVCVGPGRTRFVIKTESVNHPLFRMLLEDAEKEYGFNFAGPLTLPCEVSVFCGILEILNTDYDADDSLKGNDDLLGFPVAGLQCVVFL